MANQDEEAMAEEASGSATDGMATDGTATDGTATDGTATDGMATDGMATDATATDGTGTYGMATDDTATDSMATDGTATDSTATVHIEERERMRVAMVERVAGSSAHFGHQQRDAPDLTLQEKVDIATDLLDTSPHNFLARFGKFLQPADLAYFRPLEEDSYEVAFYLRDLAHSLTHRQVIVKNRRYAAMRELDQGGVHFSEEEMKRREPLLYQQLIGRFLTEEEREERVAAAIDRSDLRFSSILLTHLDDVRERALYQHQKDREDGQEEEEEESDEEEEEEEEDEKKQQADTKTGMEEEGEEEAEDLPEISDVRATYIWRQQLRDEFTAIMHEKFLSGHDTHFDYSQVDDNPDYDSLLTVGQDEENRYFLSEDPLTVRDDRDNDGENNDDGNDDSNDRDGLRPAANEMEEEEDDYMRYEPSADLVARSARFAQTGAWKE
ncbi:hypothetical protein ACOMHN_051008 [Nucella lapillus]